MVKADAYNHGVNEVVESTVDLVERYGVATAEEGARVRSLTDNGITVFSYTAEDAQLVSERGLTPVVHDESTLTSVIEANIKQVDVKVDTGMHRFGFVGSSDVERAVRALTDVGIAIGAIHTHFYSEASVYKQYARFSSYTGGLTCDYPEIYSASGAICKGLYGDGVRAGLIAYKGAMTVYSTILAVKEVRSGESVGYDGAYVADRDTRVGVVGGGYYDGIMRAYSGAEVIVGGRKTHIIGNVCMDVFFVDLRDIDAHVGDEVTLISPQTLDSYIRSANTTEYEVLTSVQGRAKRRFIQDGQSDIEARNRSAATADAVGSSGQE